MNHSVLLHRRHLSFAVSLVVLLSLANASGCAKAPWTSSLARDISPARQSRVAEATQNFDTVRNQAQFQAACARWQDGDPNTCEQMLQAVLQRAPNHYAVRLTLADLYAATERPELAETELQKLLERDPNDPQVHHSLGLLLESTGRPREALAHVQQAVKLDAKNELYSASEETMLAATRPSSPSSPSVAKAAGPVLASLRDVSPHIAGTPRSRVRTVAHHEPQQKSSEPTATVSPASNSAAPISRVEDDDAGEQSDDTSPSPPANPAREISAATHTSLVPPVVVAAPEPLSAPDDKPPAIHFRVESK